MAWWHRHQVLVRWLVTLVIGLYAISVSWSVKTAREESIRISCQEQNERHDNTIRQLDSILAQAGKHASPAERQQIAQSRSFTVLMIDALAPKRNCAQRVHQLSHP